jgi:hypothetical protein
VTAARRVARACAGLPLAALLLAAPAVAPTPAWSQGDDPVARPHDPGAAVVTCDAPPPQLVDEPASDRQAPMGAQGSPFSFSVTWDASVPLAWRPVIQQAMNEWTGLLTDNGCITNPLPVHFRVRALGGSLLGLCQSYASVATGCIVRDTIDFDVSSTWYVDPSPADDVEFNDPIVPPPGGADLLSVARHELGHAVGWSVTSRNSGMFSGDVFAPVRLNAWTTQTGGFHVNPSWLANDLMVPSTPASTRRAINKYPDVAVPARGFDGVVSQMVFVDPTYGGGIQNGSPSLPYSSIANAILFSSATHRMMLANTTHHLPVNSTLSSPRVIDAVRDGATVVAP